MARTAGSTSTETEARLLASALKLFAENGYAAVSMRQIAGEVGVQVGALYNYIPDKQSLLFRLLNQHMEELLGALEEAALPQVPMAALEGFTRFHIRYHAARPEAVFISYMELRNLTPENFAAIEEQRRSYEGALTAILARGQAEGAMRVEDPKLATMAIIAMLTGVNTWFRAGGRLSLDKVEEIYWDMTRRSVAA